MASDRLRFDSFNPALFETRSLPSSLATTHRGFAFYVAFPKSSIRPLGLPIYVARRRRLHSLAVTHRGFTFYVADPVSSIHHFEHRRELSEKYRSLAEFIR
jgi:hypothetical protein